MKFTLALAMCPPERILPLARLADAAGWDAVALPDSVRSPIPLPLQWLDWSDTTNCVLYSDDSNEARVFGGGFIERSQRSVEAESMLSRLTSPAAA